MVRVFASRSGFSWIIGFINGTDIFYKKPAGVCQCQDFVLLISGKNALLRNPNRKSTNTFFTFNLKSLLCHLPIKQFSLQELPGG